MKQSIIVILLLVLYIHADPSSTKWLCNLISSHDYRFSNVVWSSETNNTSTLVMLKRKVLINDPSTYELKKLENRNRRWLLQFPSFYEKDDEQTKFETLYNANMKMIIPFLSIAHLHDYINNRIPDKWLDDITAMMHIVFVVDDQLAFPNHKTVPTPFSVLTESKEIKIDQKDETKGALSTKLLDHDGLKLQSYNNILDEITKSFPKAIRNRLHLIPCKHDKYVKYISDKDEQLNQKLMMIYLSECLELSEIESISSRSNNNDIIAVVSNSMYVSPLALQSTMLSIEQSKHKAIITVENNAIITKFTTWHEFREEIVKRYGNEFITNIMKKRRLPFGGDIKSLMRSLDIFNFTILSLNEGAIKDVIHPIDNEQYSLGDYSQHESQRSLLIYKQNLLQQSGIHSCSIQSKDTFTFSDFHVSSFKKCSFVAGIRHNYEPHTIRYLQRLSRGKENEINWKKDQKENRFHKQCDIAIGITSRISNLWERMVIRKTWGQIARSMGSVQLFFLYGSPESEIPSVIEQQLKPEMNIFNDIVILPTKEGYSQMFQKVTAWLGWAVNNTNCKLIMKIDPDTYPRLFPLMKFLYDRDILSDIDNKIEKAGVYFGLANWNPKNNKDTTHRWYFHDKWPYEEIPTFMSGAMYGLTRNLASYVYKHREPDMRLDDPGIGVILHQLKQKNPAAFRFETLDPEWYPMRRCTKNRIFENSYFNPALNIEQAFRKDMFYSQYCLLYNSPDREYLGSYDDIQNEKNNITIILDKSVLDIDDDDPDNVTKEEDKDKVVQGAAQSAEFISSINQPFQFRDKMEKDTKSIILSSNMDRMVLRGYDEASNLEIHPKFINSPYISDTSEIAIVICCSWIVMIILIWSGRWLKLNMVYMFPTSHYT